MRSPASSFRLMADPDSGRDGLQGEDAPSQPVSSRPLSWPRRGQYSGRPLLRHRGVTLIATLIVPRLSERKGINAVEPCPISTRKEGTKDPMTHRVVRVRVELLASRIPHRMSDPVVRKEEKGWWLRTTSSGAWRNCGSSNIS